MYSSLVVEEFQMLFPSMLLMLGELFSTILITTISVCMPLTLCLCSSVINESVKSSSLAFGVRLDPGVRPTSPLNLIINKNFNGDTALNSYCLFSNPSQYSLFSFPPPSQILRKLLFSKWYPWEYAVLPGAFENCPSCPSWRETLKFLWFLPRRIIPFAIQLDVSLFSRMKNIVRSSDWLKLIYIWKFTTQLFIEYIWSIHMIKESEGFAEMIPYFPPAKVTSCENFHFFASSVWQLIFTLCVVWLKSYPVSWWEKEKKLHRAVKLSMSSKEGKTGYHGHVKVCPTAFFSFPMSFICASPNALYLSVNVFSTFYVLIRATRRSSRLQGNAVP